MIAAGDAQLAMPCGCNNEGIWGGGSADPLVPRHVPQSDAHVDQTVDLEPPARAFAILLHSNQDSPRVSDRREPPQFPHRERDRLAQRVPRDRLKGDGSCRGGCAGALAARNATRKMVGRPSSVIRLAW
jgi:hypothetical protein